MEGTLNVVKYQQLLTENLILVLPETEARGRDIIYQQDNATPRSANSTKDFLRRHFYHVMEWPAQSRDLSPIESVWGRMTWRIFEGNRQYATLNELETAVVDCWSQISQEILEKLADSVKDRVLEVLKKNGGPTLSILSCYF